MYHGLLFDRSGSVIEIPGQPKIPEQAKVRSFPVAERHSWIWVWMGDAAAADTSLIPEAVGLDHPDYILGHGHLDYAAEARLINDNLLDFSHLSYVHPKSFGATEEWARERPTITTLERGIRVERWLPNRTGMPGRPVNEPNDSYSRYDFMVPGILLMTGGMFPIGSQQRFGDGEPDMSEAFAGVTYTSQAVTPMKTRAARYFFSWGPHRNHGDAAHRDLLMSIAAVAFGEDRSVIEAQQRVIDDTETPRIMPITADRGVTLYNLVVERLARAEKPAAVERPLRHIS